MTQALLDARVDAQDKLDSRSDLQLIAAINAGDAAAFDALYFRYRDWVAGLAFRFTGSEDLALDVLQETFLYVLRKFPGFKLTAHFKTFLYPAVKNLSISAQQKASRYQSTESEQNFLAGLVSAEQPTAELNELAIVLARLSEEHREALLLRFVDGLELAEIAEAMNIPLGTVKSRLHNALTTLRKDERTREYFGR
jgi:RNA polymerase sigma-70 factor (ECF subfamily)